MIVIMLMSGCRCRVKDEPEDISVADDDNGDNGDDDDEEDDDANCN